MDIASFIQNPTVILLIAIWTLPWKGVALWRAAQLRDKWWFIAMLVLNTIAILEILYIFVFSKRKSLAFRSGGM
ncbi:MAG: hypothetical protein KGJ13_04610 [Patescibacteria group bacterium]|nr:hypothetical protein [Patescibacteria group bacterium]